MWYKIVYFVPESHLDVTKEAAFSAGAGRFKNYQRVCWQTLGTGQFEPQCDAQPAIGEVGQVEKVAEYRVEMLCHDHHLEAVLVAIKHAHLYEVPAIEAMTLVYPTF